MKNKFSNLKNDCMAGIIVALVSIPISMGYSQIAGLSPVYGLFGSLFPVFVYAFITSSPQFVFGVDATPAALVGGMLATLGITTGSQEAGRLVPVITMVVALWLLIFYIIRAGKIVKFISTPVMGGFISGIGVTIILMQVAKLFGGSAGTGELFTLMKHIYGQLGEFNLLSAVLGFGTVVIILIFKKIAPKFPMSVLLMVVGGLLTAVFHIDDYGVKLLPPVEAGLPKFAFPDMMLIKGNASEIIIPSFTIALVILAQTLLAANNYALRYDYKINNNREVLAYSLSNMVAALTGCCPLNGSVSRTGIADQFGCKSQMMSVSAGVTMLLVVLFGTPLLKYLPVPILTGIVVAALIGIIEYKLAIKLWKVNRSEFMIFMAAFFGVLIFGTIYGVIIGVILSFIAVIIRAVVPPKSFVGVIPYHEGFYNLNRNRNARPIKNTVIYRFSGTLFFANVGTFQEDIENAVKPDTKQVIVDASGIGSIDVTAADRLLLINKSLKNKGIKFYITEHVYTVNDQLRALGAGSLVEEGVVRRTISLALRDAGVEKPYPLEDADNEVCEEFVEDSERLAEFEWAFGKDAQAHMEKMAQEVVENINKDNDDFEHLVVNAENNSSWGRIGLFDEDELLERLEMHLSELAHKTGHTTEELEEQIENRRLVIEEKIKKLNPEAMHLLIRHRHELAKDFRKNNPGAYGYMLKMREEHIKRLEAKNPELAEKMKNLYDKMHGDDE